MPISPGWVALSLSCRDRARYPRDLRADASPAPSPGAGLGGWIGSGRGGDHGLNEAEILNGIARLPDGRRKQSLQQSWDGLVADIFAGRVWPFSSEAAHWYAQLLRSRERSARPMATADAVIAATALAHGAQLATRDVADFADVGLGLINPWAA